MDQLKFYLISLVLGQNTTRFWEGNVISRAGRNSFEIQPPEKFQDYPVNCATVAIQNYILESLSRFQCFQNNFSVIQNSLSKTLVNIS